MSQEQSSSKGPKTKKKGDNNFDDKCFRCVNVPPINTYESRSTKKISRLAYKSAKKLDGRYTSLNPKGKLIKACVRCISDESISKMEHGADLHGTAYEFFVLMKLREHINNLGLFKNMALEYNPKNADDKEYDLLISDGGSLRRPRRIILIETDEKKHYDNEEEFLKDRAKEFYFLNTFRKGPNDKGSKTNKTDSSGNATILRIRVGENGGKDEGGKNLDKMDTCIVEENTPKGVARKIIVQKPDLFKRNIDRIIKHIERFFSDNGDFSKSAYINLNNDTGVQDYNVDYQTKYPGKPKGESIDFIGNGFLSGREYDYGQDRIPSPTTSNNNIQGASSTPSRTWMTSNLGQLSSPTSTPDTPSSNNSNTSNKSKGKGPASPQSTPSKSPKQSSSSGPSTRTPKTSPKSTDIEKLREKFLTKARSPGKTSPSTPRISAQSTPQKSEPSPYLKEFGEPVNTFKMRDIQKQLLAIASEGTTPKITRETEATSAQSSPRGKSFKLTPAEVASVAQYAEQSGSRASKDNQKLLEQMALIFSATSNDFEGRPLIKILDEKKKCEDYSIQLLQDVAKTLGIPAQDMKETQAEMCAEIFKMREHLTKK